MTQASQPSTSGAKQARDAEIARVLDKVKALTRDGVDREVLEQVKAELLKVAARAELFPAEEFPPTPLGQSSLYLLRENADHSYAFYASAPRAGHASPPHNHTTWAVIAGVRGREHNKVYRRTDDGSRPGVGRVEVEKTVDIVPGTGLALMPEDIHSIHLGNDGPHLNLHVYGMSVEYVPGRVAYDAENGTYKVFGPMKGIVK